MCTKSSATCGGHSTSPFVYRSAIQFGLGQSAMGQRLASSRRPLRWPLSRPAITYAGQLHLPKSVLFRRSVIAIPPRNNRLWATHSVGRARGSDAPAAESRAPTPCRCRPCGERRSPSLVRLITTAVYPAHNDDRPFESGTPRGQRPVLGDVPPHTPHAVPGYFAVSPTKTGPATARSLGRPSGRLTRGSDAPCGRKRRPKLGRRLSPAGTSLPPRSNSQLEIGPARLHGAGRSPRNISPCCGL